MAHPVTWFQITGRDGDRLQTFYQNVFEWKMQPGADGSVAMVSAEKPGGIPGGVGASRDGAPSVAVYVDVTDLAGHLARIEQAGGRIAMAPMDLPGGMGTIAGFLDPEGNWVGLWQSPPKAARRSTSRAARRSKPKPRPKPKRKTSRRARRKR